MSLLPPCPPYSGRCVQGVALALVLLSGAFGLGGCGGDRPKNLVLIVVDTLRADAILDESGEVRVPGLRAFAEDTAVFKQCFSHASLTRPSHAALFSSRMPSEAGVIGNADSVPPDVPLLADWLQQHGYQTGAASSFSFTGGPDPRNKKPGLVHGFERVSTPDAPLRWSDETLPLFRTMLEGVDGEKPFFFFLHLVDPHYPYRDHLQRDPSEREPGAEAEDILLWNGGDLLDRLSATQPIYQKRPLSLPPGEHTLAFRGNSPFQLVYFNPVAKRSKVEWHFQEGQLNELGKDIVISLVNHEKSSVSVTLKYACYDRPNFEESRRRYRTEVEYVDAALGQVFELLRERGLYDDTVIVFTSDHGEGLGEHGVMQHAVNLFDELLHVPLFLKPPASRAPVLEGLRQHTDELVSHIDVVPTVLEMVGVPPLPGQRGQSIFGARSGLHLAEGHPPFASQLQFCVRDEHFKLIFHPGQDEFFLYDLDEDPHESVNLFPSGLGQRAGWPDLLRGLGNAPHSAPAESLDPSVESELRALGYLGEAEGDSHEE